MKLAIQHRPTHFFLAILAICTFLLAANVMIKAAAMCETDDFLCGNAP